MRTLAANVLIALVYASAAWAVGPGVTNVVARQLTNGTGRVLVTYNLSDPDSATVYVSVEISTDGGSTYLARSHVTGDIGWVRPGTLRRIWWDAKASLGASAVFPNCKAKITADDSSGGVYPGQMIYIPAGSFLMGNCGVGDDLYYDQLYNLCYEKPQHSVNVSGYWIGKYEVTRGEYRQFMNAGGYSNSAYWSSAGWSWKVSSGRTQPYYWTDSQNWCSPPGTFTQTDNHPVVGVSYYECEAFCNWAGGHLPTEAQWEKAARWDGHPRVYPWGDTWDQQKCNNWDDSLYPGCQTAPVGSYPSGASPYGCQDMAGNVWEWVQDWFVTYPGSTCPMDYTGSSRVLRGGGWDYGYGDSYGRCAFRSYLGGPGSYWGGYGFRLAR